MDGRGAARVAELLHELRPVAMDAGGGRRPSAQELHRRKSLVGLPDAANVQYDSLAGLSDTELEVLAHTLEVAARRPSRALYPAARTQPPSVPGGLGVPYICSSVMSCSAHGTRGTQRLGRN